MNDRNVYWNEWPAYGQLRIDDAVMIRAEDTDRSNLAQQSVKQSCKLIKILSNKIYMWCSFFFFFFDRESIAKNATIISEKKLCFFLYKCSYQSPFSDSLMCCSRKKNFIYLFIHPLIYLFIYFFTTK